MDVVVEVGGWEHQCCGEAVERGQLVDFRCIRSAGPDGRVRLSESHHGGLDVPAGERVQGRVVDIAVVREGAAPVPVLRLPSGRALGGSDEHDDGHLEDPWTGEVVAPVSEDFLVTVRTARSPSGPR
ncbi:hypothetical protein [Modestobacter sp. NPDC049651]|uniref:DUF6578 domain-containing protein n=1 Tax=unclassified Modestobacter TaxID=2643866 RepID=UPI0033E56B7D